MPPIGDHACVGMPCSAPKLAALLHDVGRAGVDSSSWDRPGPLGAADRERVRLHPHWTERVLSSTPVLAPLAPLAAAHHERLDGTGYHRAARAADLPRGARLLAAADVLAAMTEDRPYRPARTRDESARIVQDEAVAGRLDPEMVAAVIEAAGVPRPRTAWPNDLTDARSKSCAWRRVGCRTRRSLRR